MKKILQSLNKLELKIEAFSISQSSPLDPFPKNFSTSQPSQTSIPSAGINVARQARAMQSVCVSVWKKRRAVVTLQIAEILLILPKCPFLIKKLIFAKVFPSQLLNIVS